MSNVYACKGVASCEIAVTWAKVMCCRTPMVRVWMPCRQRFVGCLKVSGSKWHVSAASGSATRLCLHTCWAREVACSQGTWFQMRDLLCSLLSSTWTETRVTPWLCFFLRVHFLSPFWLTKFLHMFIKRLIQSKAKAACLSQQTMWIPCHLEASLQWGTLCPLPNRTVWGRNYWLKSSGW